MQRSDTRSQWVKDLLYKLWSPEGNVREKTRLAARQGWLEPAWTNSGEQTSWKQSRTALQVFSGANKDTGISAKAKENTKEWHCVVTIQDVIIWRWCSGETRVIKPELGKRKTARLSQQHHDTGEINTQSHLRLCSDTERTTDGRRDQRWPVDSSSLLCINLTAAVIHEGHCSIIERLCIQ